MNSCTNIGRPFTNMLVRLRCLSTFPKGGQYSQDIAKYKEEIKKLKEQRDILLGLRDNVKESRKLKTKLTSRDLYFINNKLDAKFIARTYNLLSRKNRLNLLYQSIDEIYPGQYHRKIDPLLEKIRRQYEKKSYVSFRCIVLYLKELKKGDLANSKNFII